MSAVNIEQHIKKQLKDDVATQELGANIAKHINAPSIIHLRGDLGSGKTTLARGFIQTLGHKGNVKSPTFSLVEIVNKTDIGRRIMQFL